MPLPIGAQLPHFEYATQWLGNDMAYEKICFPLFVQF